MKSTHTRLRHPLCQYWAAVAGIGTEAVKPLYKPATLAVKFPKHLQEEEETTGGQRTEVQHCSVTQGPVVCLRCAGELTETGLVMSKSLSTQL